MTQLTHNQILLREVKIAFDSYRGSTLVAMQKLWEVKESGVWQELSPTWSEFVESELGISQGFASKLLSVHKTYVLDGGYSQEKLAGIDYERLYLARGLEGTVEEKVEKARLLTRRELKEERNDEVPHEHIPIEICKTCSIRL